MEFELSKVVRADFAFLRNTSCIYMDSASTSLKPDIVIDAMMHYYQWEACNVGRSNHHHAQLCTQIFEDIRSQVGQFINCASDEIIFTSNCTDSINLAAFSLNLSPADHVIISPLEHHSNLLPWTKTCRVSTLRLMEDGRVDLDYLDAMLIKDPAKVVAVCHASNITGNIQPVEEITKIARRHNAISLVDAAQTAGHINIDVAKINCDFLAFSAHKMLGPSGVGILYARRDIQPTLRCFRYGGGMVNRVSVEGIDYSEGPARFEAGTPNIEGIIGLGAAITYLSQIGMTSIQRHHHQIDHYLHTHLKKLNYIQPAFPLATDRLPITSFRLSGSIETGVIARLLSDHYGIAVSDGYQCNQPLYRAAKIPGGIRISLHMYNTAADIDTTFAALSELQPLMA